MTPTQTVRATTGTLGLTLSRHIIQQERLHPDFAGGLSTLLAQAGYVGKTLSREVGRAALVGRLGLVGDKNATGDAQKKLDVYSNNVCVEAFADTGVIAAMVSEEMERVAVVEGAEDADYILCMDPLDGSSNTDINGTLGTIFGVWRRKRDGAGMDGEFRRRGSEQALAGYIMYSTSTVLVYTTGHGVYGFTLDRDLGEFLLSHDQIRCPDLGKAYSANVAHLPEWSPNIQRYVEYLNQHDPATRRPYSLRYTGALVADLHRCLVEGGLYFYPPATDHRQGKLRLMYECAPLAYIVENAGGLATSGVQRILDIESESIHQRAPFAIGSREDVELYERFYLHGRP